MTFSLYRNLFGEIFHYKSYDALLNEFKKNRQKNGQTKKYSTVLYEQIFCPCRGLKGYCIFSIKSAYIFVAPQFFFLEKTLAHSFPIEIPFRVIY